MHRQTYRHMHTQTYSHTQTHRHTHTHTQTHTDTHTDKHVLTSSELWSSMLQLPWSVDTLCTGVPTTPTTEYYATTK